MKDFISGKFENMNTVGRIMICAGAAVAIVLVPVLVFLGHRDKNWRWRKSPEAVESTED